MTKTSPVRVGVVGLGAIGERLIQGFAEQDGIRVAAVCDNLAERAAQFAERLGGIAFFTNHQDMLAQAELDLVYVAVPPKFHHAVVLDALAAKKHVLCEKPLANSLPEAAEMWRAAAEAGVITAMNFPLNYSAALNKFAALYQNGYIGKLARIELNMQFPQWPRLWQQNAWVGGREQGGYVLEVGVHFIQMLQRVFGPITRVKSRLEFPADPAACEIAVTAQLELADGTPIFITGASQVPGEEIIALTATGDNGVLELRNWGTLYGAAQGEALQQLPLADVRTTSLIDNLVRALAGQQAHLYDFAVGYNAQVVLEALRHPQHDDFVDVSGQLANY